MYGPLQASAKDVRPGRLVQTWLSSGCQRPPRHTSDDARLEGRRSGLSLSVVACRSPSHPVPPPGEVGGKGELGPESLLAWTET